MEGKAAATKRVFPAGLLVKSVTVPTEAPWLGWLADCGLIVRDPS